MHAMDLVALLRMQAESAASGALQFFPGHVASWDPVETTVTVLLKPANLTTGDIQYITSWTGSPGSESGCVGGPEVGTQVMVIALDKDFEHLICMPGTFNLKNVGPKVPSGEWWVVHKLVETYVKLVNAGSLLLGGYTAIQLTSPLIEFSDTLTALGSGNAVVRQSDLKAVVDALNTKIATLQTHIHEDPLTGFTGTSAGCLGLTDVVTPGCSPIAFAK